MGEFVQQVFHHGLLVAIVTLVQFNFAVPGTALEGAVLLYGVYYAYKAMRKFYGQGRGKTILKFLILNFLAFWSIIFLFTAFFLFAVFKF